MEYARVLYVLVCYFLVSSTKKLEGTVDNEGCNTNSTCIVIQDCKILLDFIIQNDNLSDDIKRELKGYACGPFQDTIKVCCPNKLPASWTQDAVSSGSADHSQHKHIKLLPGGECGQTVPQYKILDGNRTLLTAYPWIAALKYDIDDNPFRCGATLISKRYVLTAAQCIRNRYKLVGVRLGEYNFSSPIDCFIENEECVPEPQNFEISAEDVKIHENYDEDTLVNDIALIRLRRDADTNEETVYPICLPVTADEKAKRFVNYTVVGWGLTETGIASNVPIFVLVPAVENSKCAGVYAARMEITDNQMCAGGRVEQDSCAGDTGGHLYAEYILLDTKRELRTMQYGILSFGPTKCGRKNIPAVYTRVDKYMGWILDNMKP